MLAAGETLKGPSFIDGAAMQWLNPKAWLASLTGMGAYAGTFLRKYLRNSRHVRMSAGNHLTACQKIALAHHDAAGIPHQSRLVSTSASFKFSNSIDLL